MQARVRADSEQHVITSCSGCEFVKKEWRPVPPGFEAEAQRCQFLEVQVQSDFVPIPASKETEVKFVPGAPVETPKPAVKRKGGKP